MLGFFKVSLVIDPRVLRAKVPLFMETMLDWPDVRIERFLLCRVGRRMSIVDRGISIYVVSSRLRAPSNGGIHGFLTVSV